MSRRGAEFAEERREVSASSAPLRDTLKRFAKTVSDDPNKRDEKASLGPKMGRIDERFFQQRWGEGSNEKYFSEYLACSWRGSLPLKGRLEESKPGIGAVLSCVEGVYSIFATEAQEPVKTLIRHADEVTAESYYLGENVRNGVAGIGGDLGKCVETTGHRIEDRLNWHSV